MITWDDMFKKMGELINLDKYTSYNFYNAYFMDNGKSITLPEAKLLDKMCKCPVPLFVKELVVLHILIMLGTEFPKTLSSFGQ